MTRILVLGGYGGFGGRISRRLACEGHEVVVAGRSLAKARAFCSGDARLVPAVISRAGISAGLAEWCPAIIVDASGPFQAMDLSVPRAAIAAGVHYCDIADGSAFVRRIATLNSEAQAAGVVVLSGASSVPALSGSVVRELAIGMTRITSVEIAISASNQATVGGSVAEAILGQVGQPFIAQRGGRRETLYGWQEIECQAFSVPGHLALRGRRVALVDVPDIALLPDRLPGRPSVTFRAGAELGFQNWALWILSWAVRWGWLGGLGGLSRLLMSLQSLTAWMGSDRSAMTVRLFGISRGQRVERRWTLIANEGDGPEIPTLAIAPLVARILRGKEPSGARDAGEALTLADYDPTFDELAVRHSAEEIVLPDPLYHRVMGNRFHSLPRAVRAMHDVLRDGGASGEADVIGAANPIGALIARVFGFPRAGQYSLHVAFAESDGVECWTRHFGTTRFDSELSARGRRLVERFGPIRFGFDLLSEQAGLTMIMRHWSVLGVPLPLAIAPRSIVREWEEDGRFHFDVPIALPLVGRIVHYRGWLEVIG